MFWRHLWHQAAGKSFKGFGVYAGPSKEGANLGDDAAHHSGNDGGEDESQQALDEAAAALLNQLQRAQQVAAESTNLAHWAMQYSNQAAAEAQQAVLDLAMLAEEARRAAQRHAESRAKLHSEISRLENKVEDYERREAELAAKERAAEHRQAELRLKEESLVAREAAQEPPQPKAPAGPDEASFAKKVGSTLAPSIISVLVSARKRHHTCFSFPLYAAIQIIVAIVALPLRTCYEQRCHSDRNTCFLLGLLKICSETTWHYF